MPATVKRTVLYIPIEFIIPWDPDTQYRGKFLWNLPL